MTQPTIRREGASNYLIVNKHDEPLGKIAVANGIHEVLIGDMKKPYTTASIDRAVGFVHGYFEAAEANVDG